jgi:vancomycin resistance protein YoaR
MTDRVYQTGGKEHHWLFDPQDVDNIAPILNKLSIYDEYFVENEGATTLSIVLDSILDELSPELEEAVRLTHLAGISYRSAAKIIGCDHKTVKARSERGIIALRKRLTDTVWLASLISGLIPEQEIESPKVKSPEKILGVLNKISSIRSGNEE